jgi:hypothetical protein
MSMSTEQKFGDTLNSDEAPESVTTDARAPDHNRIESHTLLRSDAAGARHVLIAEAAYRKSQQRDFAPGDDWQDWFAAEREVDALLDPNL